MGKPTQPKRVLRYTTEFKLKAVKLSNLPGVQVQQVAEALDVHPFMLSRWRKEVREGRLKGRKPKIDLPSRVVSELRQFVELQRRYALLKEEHDLLKKAIRFCSLAKKRSLPSLPAPRKDER